MTKGCLTLVSLGPGGLDYLPPIARDAIQSSETVIGYRFYLDLIRQVIVPGQSVIESSLGEEMKRATQAIELAVAGQRVAMVSSGDVGIYGMAGPTFEALHARGWQPGDLPDVCVIPGISALQAVAARLGAAIAHDFCAISLSDLHTPWPVIARRIDAAGWGDFVIALFNPRSRERDWQLAEAQRLLLLHRSSDTPVAVARNATRPDEGLAITTLGALDAARVDMFTLVIVGNSQTVHLGGQLATPRGYTHVHLPDIQLIAHQSAAAAQTYSYPINLVSLRDLPIVVVGGGPVAERKVQVMLNAGAHVRLISPTITPRLEVQVQSGRVEWVARQYRPGDVAGARLAVAATNNRQVNAGIARECHTGGILVNVADAPGECDFTVPAVARRDGLTIAVSTDDYNPGRAVRVRNQLLAMEHYSLDRESCE